MTTPTNLFDIKRDGFFGADSLEHISEAIGAMLYSNNSKMRKLGFALCRTLDQLDQAPEPCAGDFVVVDGTLPDFVWDVLRPLQSMVAAFAEAAVLHEEENLCREQYLAACACSMVAVELISAVHRYGQEVVWG